ncbi:MAG: phosphatase PAP2 family protein [Actinomycetota bacterium]|nr:phosphatase PAP2 family protein [Actinomycetota bacterium]
MPAPSPTTQRPIVTARQPMLMRWIAWGVPLGVLGLLLGFLLTAIGARATGEYALDINISQHRDTFLIDLSRTVNIVGGPMFAPFVLLALAALIWWRFDLGSAGWFFGLAVVGWFSVAIAKTLVHRQRPPTAAVHSLVMEHAADSFPSGHTALAAGIVFGAAVALRHQHGMKRLILLIGVPFLLLVALSRLVLGAHYLGDVTGAPLIAGAAILTVTGLLHPFESSTRNRLNAVRRPHQPEEHRPEEHRPEES